MASIFKFLTLLALLLILNNSVVLNTINVPSGYTFVSKQQHPDELKFFMEYSKVDGSNNQIGSLFRIIFFNPDTDTYQTSIQLNRATTIMQKKAVSKSLNCAIIYTPSTTKTQVYKFDTVNPNSVFADISSLVTGATLLQISDQCNSFKKTVAGVVTVYHWNPTAATPAFEVDNALPAWTNAVYSNNFNIVAADDGIYTYSSKTYTKSKSITLYSTKKVLMTQKYDRLVIYSNDASGNYKLCVYKVSGTTLTDVLNSIGQTSSTNTPPKIAYSQTLQNIVVYGQSLTTPGTSFYDIKSIDYSNSNFNTLTLPPTTANNFYSQVILNDKYLYAKSTTNYAAFYFVRAPSVAPILKLYNQAPKSSDQTNSNWVKSIIYDSTLQILSLYHFSYTIAAGTNGQLSFSTLDTKSPNNKLFWIDSTNAGLWKPISMPESKLRLGWFTQAKQTTDKAFRMTFFDGTVKQNNAFTLASGYTIKNLSYKQTCAILSDGTTTSVYLFTQNANPQLFSTITSLLTGVTNPSYQISDDCKGLKISSVIYHWNTGLNSYETDTLPAWNNPTFSNDFTYAVADNGIFKYTERVGATIGFYSLDRSETFYSLKTIFRLGDNILISSCNSIEFTGNYNFKIQINTISPSSPNLIKIDQTTGISRDIPSIAFSSSLINIIIYGLNQNGIPFYNAKKVDYLNSQTFSIVIPPQISNSQNYIAVSDDFVYVRNKIPNPTSNTINHMGYSIIGNLLAKSFQQSLQDQTKVDNWYRTFLIPGVAGKMTLAHQFFTGGLIRFEKDERPGVDPTLAAKQSPNSMQVTVPTTSVSTILSQQSMIGQWVYTSSTGTKINYIKYDPSVANSYSTIQSPTLTGNNIIKATSESFNCMITFVSGSSFNIISISSSTSIIENMYTTLLSDGFTDASISALTSNEVQVGDNCWAFKVGSKIYTYKPASTPKFAKDNTASSWTNAVFSKNLKFSFVGNKAYKWSDSNGGAYNLIFSSPTSHRNTKQIFINKDGNRGILFSYQPGTVNGSNTPYLYKLEYILEGTGPEWDFMSIGYVGTTGNGIPKIVYTPQFDIVGMKFVNSANQLDFILTKVIGDPLVPSFLIPLVIKNSPINNDKFSLSQNYLYFTNTQQIVYKIDRINLKLVQIFRRTLLTEDTTNLVKALSTEPVIGSVVIMYEYITTDGIISVRKRQLGGTDTQQILMNIQQSTTGLVILNGQPVVCSPGCKVCLNPQNCQTCLDGFTLSNSICIRCQAPCKTCSSGSPQECTGCFEGFILTGINCVRCNDACLSCSGTTTNCVSCKVGQYVSSGACVNCIQNCQSCTSSSCTLCRIGYVYSSTLSQCLKCLSGCTNCNQTKLSQCNQCFQGFEPIYDSNNKITSCQKCPNFCKSCTNGTCLQCRTNFRLVNNKCVNQCRLPCKQCQQSDPNKCNSCIGSYTYDSTTKSCIPDISCNTGSTCTNCPLGYVLLLKNCYQCQGGANCSTCDNTDPTKCVGCVRGYYLNELSTCNLCSQGCSLCDNFAYCKECMQGFTLSGTSTQSKCIKCSPQCATCIRSPNNCEKCAANFTNIGWKCVSKMNVKFSFKLEGVFDNFMSTHYTAIEAQFCNKINKSKDKVTLKVLKSGSILIQGIVDSDVSEQQGIVDTLISQYGAGSQINGFTIIGSSFQAVVDDQVVYTGQKPVQQTQSRKTAIIVPIVVIIISIIIGGLIYLYKKGIIFGNNQSSTLQVNDINNIQEFARNDSTFNQLKLFSVF